MTTTYITSFTLALHNIRGDLGLFLRIHEIMKRTIETLIRPAEQVRCRDYDDFAACCSDGF
jgi:hypothetical protein